MLYVLPQSYLYDPQQVNSYGYARNNPVVYSDPSGAFTWSSFAGFVTGTAVNTGKSVVSGLSAIGNAVLSPRTTYHSAVSTAKAAQNYFSNTSVSTMASQAKGAVFSGGSSLVDAYNTTSFSGGYAAGEGTAGSIVGVVATFAVGGVVANAGRVGEAGNIVKNFDAAAQQAQKLSGFSNPKAITTVESLFKRSDTIPGGTAGAIRNETITGEKTAGKFHYDKGQQSVNRINNLLDRETLTDFEVNKLTEYRDDILDAINR